MRRKNKTSRKEASKVKRIALFLALVLAVVFSVPAIAAPFPDVPSNHWAYDAVNELASKGLIIGYPDGTFRGNNPLTRYEFAMVISRLISYLEKVSGGPSIDVSQFVTKGELANTLANYVTTDQLADYVTVDQLADYVTTDQLADYVTTDQLANYVTTDQLSNYVTTDQLSDYVTFDALADYVTTDQLANYVTTDQLSNYVTTDQLADYVTTDQLADYVTVDQLADYVTVDQLADYVTTDQLSNYVTTDQLADYVTTDQLADYVTVDQLADYVTVDQLADYVTTDQLADYVTTDQLADYVTVDQLADYVTTDQLADYVTVDQLADYVTTDQLADYVTVDQLADYVTTDQLSNYVTTDQLADYVTTDQLADYVTVDQLADYVTVDQLADYVTTDQLANYVTTDQLSNYVTTDQLSDYVTFDTLSDYVTFDDLAGYVTTDMLADYVTFDDLASYVSQDDFDALKTLVSDLSDQFETMGVDVKDLQDRVSALEDTVANLNTVSSEKVAELESRVSTLEKKALTSVTTNVTVTSNYKLGDTTQEPTALGTTTDQFLSLSGIYGLANVSAAIPNLTTDVQTPDAGNVTGITSLPSTGMTAGGHLTLTINVPGKSGSDKIYGQITLSAAANDDISAFFTGLPAAPSFSISSFKAYATDGKLTAEAGDLTAFKFTNLTLDDARLFKDKNGNPITQRGLTLTYNLTDNIKLQMSQVYLNDNNYSQIYDLPQGTGSDIYYYSIGGKWYQMNGNQDAENAAGTDVVPDTAADGDVVATNMNTSGTYYFANNQWYLVKGTQDATPGTPDPADTPVSAFQPVWANRVSMKLGEPLTLNLNLVKEATNRIVGGGDATIKLGNINIGAEYELAMDKNFQPLSSDAAAMTLNATVPLGSILTVNAGYEDVGPDYSALWGSYTKDRTGYTAGISTKLGNSLTLQAGYAAEKDKSTNGATLNKTGYGVGLKTNILGAAVQYVSTTDNVAGTTTNTVEASLAPISWLTLATKYNIGTSELDASASIAIPNLPKFLVYYTPNSTFKYGVAMSQYTFFNFLTLAAQFDQNPSTPSTQFLVDGSVKLTNNLSLVGRYVNYPNAQTSWEAGVNYTYKWSDNANLSVNLKHVVDPFGTEANALVTTVAVTF